VETGTSGPKSALGVAKAMKANAARIAEAAGTSGPTSAPGAAIGVTAARPEATDPRSIPLLVRKWIVECARAAPIQVDARSPACVIAAQGVAAASREVALDRVNADLN
jgi:hypothetical protein